MSVRLIRILTGSLSHHKNNLRYFRASSKLEENLKMRLVLFAALVNFVVASKVDEECTGRCCTLKISRPVGDENKYSGVYSLEEDVYVMDGNQDVTMEVVDSDFYDYGEEDYVTLENWGIMDAAGPRWQRGRPVVEGGWTGEDPVGDWPNGGEAKCLKKGENGLCEVLEYTHARGENGIYEELTDVYMADSGWRSWKQTGNIFWYFSFNEDAASHNVHEGGFTKSEDQDYFDDYSDDKSGGTLEGEWTDGTVIECIGKD